MEEEEEEEVEAAWGLTLHRHDQLGTNHHMNPAQGA